jgi:FKBP-type peptidyl-prolyl cis-trans isomerase
MKVFKALLGCIITLGLLSSSCDRNTQKQLPKSYTEDELMDAHKRKVGRETELIEAFIDHNGWEMAKTKTGIRYDIYAKGTGDSARTDMVAEVDYSVYMLDSMLVETARGETRKLFRIGHDDVVSGLHEAITLMHVGDSARLIIPSYLAYGLSGNQKNIPPNAALLYDITLVGLH